VFRAKAVEFVVDGLVVVVGFSQVITDYVDCHVGSFAGKRIEGAVSLRRA